MATAPRDDNRIPSLLGTSKTDGLTPILVYVDDSTNRLYVDAIISDNVTTETKNEALRVDDTTTANVTYVGYAVIGSLSSASVWKIKKIDTTSGVVITWADGDSSYNNIWDNRASLSYS
jgi:hypothetical protein